MSALLDNAINPRTRIRDVSNVLAYLRLESTPVITLIKDGAKPKSTLYEWTTRGRFNATDNAIQENVDVQDSEIINNQSLRYVLQGRTQKGRVVIGVDDVAEELGNEYAVEGGESADNLMDAMVLVRENQELTTIKNGDSQPFISGTQARKLRGLTKWALITDRSTDLPIDTGALPVSGQSVTGRSAATDVTMGDFIGMLQAIATARRGLQDVHVFASPALRTRLSGLTQFVPAQSTDLVVQRFNQPDIKAITMTVERMRCDFGEFYLHTHFTLPSGVHALVIAMDYVKMRPVRKAGAQKLPYLGGVHKTMIEYIFGLEVTNTHMIGAITT